MNEINHNSKQSNHMIKLRYCFGLILAMTFLLTSCGSNYVTQYKPTPSVSTKQFCQANLIGQANPLKKSELDVLEDKQRIKDETTIALMLKSAAYNISEQSESVENCEQDFKQGEALFQQISQINQNNLANKKGFKPAKDAQIYQAQQMITDLWREDQSARTTLIALPLGEKKGSAFWANRLASANTIRADIKSTKYLKELLKQYDWIDQQRFGVPVSAHAWILIQHADDQVELQAEVLKRMEPYFKNGGIRPANYAYLWDRVAVNRGQLQRYGTQPIWTCKQGQLELQPIEDLATANRLRKEIGMNTVEAGLAEMSQSVCAAGPQ